MIKFIHLFVWLAYAVSYGVYASTFESKIEKEVLESFDKIVHAAKTLDADYYFRFIDNDKFVGLNSDGTNWNSSDDLKPLIIGGFGAINEILALEFTNVKVSVLDTHNAILVNEFVQTFTLKSGETITVAGGGTQVWHKSNGAWKLVSISASNKPIIE